MSFLKEIGYSNRIEFPDLYLVRQEIHAQRLKDVASTLNRKLDKFNLLSKVQAGQRVAITAGSRGVKDNPLVLREVPSSFKTLGAKPFIAPAMGSHGGATSEGQAEVLRNLGIEESTIGAPIVSSVDVVEIGRTRGDIPILIGRDFAEAEHVVVVNRTKPHTDFIGEIESGLLKIMVIGMGKAGGAMRVHHPLSVMDFKEW